MRFFEKQRKLRGTDRWYCRLYCTEVRGSENVKHIRISFFPKISICRLICSQHRRNIVARTEMTADQPVHSIFH